MKPFSLRIHLVTAFTLLVLTVGGLIGWTGQMKTVKILHESSENLTDSINRSIREKLSYRHSQAQNNLRLLVISPGVSAPGLDERLAALDLLKETLQHMPAAVSVYTGYADGDYFLLRRLLNIDDRNIFDAPNGTAYVVQSIERDKGKGRFIYYDAGLREILRKDRPQSLSFDPRTRPWYVAAQKSEDIVETLPYQFFTSGKMGTSLALKFDGGRATLGVDMRLDDFSGILHLHRPTPGSRLALFDDKGTVLASDEPVFFSEPAHGPSVFSSLMSGESRSKGLKQKRINLGQEYWQGSLLRVSGLETQGLFLALMIPEREILSHAQDLLHEQAVIALVLLALGLLLGMWFSHRLSKALIRLSGTVDAVRHFDFSGNAKGPVRSRILEVETLSQSMEQMRHTISRFLDITAKVAGEENLERMLPSLLENTMETAAAQAGVLYLNIREVGELRPVVAFGEKTSIDTETLRVQSQGKAPLGLSKALDSGRPVISHPSGPELTDKTGLVFPADSLHTLAVPLVNRQGDRLGALFLCSDDVFDTARSRFIEYLSGYASVSLETRELIQAQKKLFDAFVRLIAHAIDTKSPYTGAHCIRVPELTRMLAEAACAETDGPFADFQLDDKDWEAVNLAAWLHDCGKVTTPEFVVDKATRLESLYDRIHEIRTRFEVLKREKEAACWKSIAQGADEKEAREALRLEWQQLDEDFEFVAECNLGETFMSDERCERLASIAKHTWTRTLSDRIGIGPEEESRKALMPEAPLPFPEALLSDRADHKIKHLKPIDYPKELGITLKPRPLLYDRGELKNLSIKRGTLTDEERFKINEHIIQTLIMLSRLPLPYHLRLVPDMAAGHHERMDGKGYPREIMGQDIHPIARMMTIADIFEALTANDRPYKTAKDPQTALKIMRSMASEGHIDTEFFELFERAGIVERYTAMHLS